MSAESLSAITNARATLRILSLALENPDTAPTEADIHEVIISVSRTLGAVIEAE